jgi:ribosomal protein S18 acetylase RimI-like enzyme
VLTATRLERAPEVRVSDSLTDPRGSGEITRLYTHPRGQGRGAARHLLGRALEALRAAGCTEAWLNTEERNEDARRFYERQGWVEDGRPRVRDWHGARLVEPRYVKRL